MKLAKSRLQQIIKEEIDNLGEGFFGDVVSGIFGKSHYVRNKTLDPAIGWKMVQQGKEDVDKRMMKQFKERVAATPNSEEVLKLMGQASPDGNYGTYLMARTYEHDKMRGMYKKKKQNQDAAMGSAFLNVAYKEFEDFVIMAEENDERAKQEAVAQKKKEAEKAKWNAEYERRQAQQKSAGDKAAGDKEAQERCKQRTGMGSRDYYKGAPNHQRRVEQDYNDCLKELRECRRTQRKRRKK